MIVGAGGAKPERELKLMGPMIVGIAPISEAERRDRIAKAQPSADVDNPLSYVLSSQRSEIAD